MTPFVFYDAPDFGDAMIAHVRAGIANVDELYDALAEAMHFPSYFGRNWDALDEVLADLAWLVPRRVVIVHADVPALPPDSLRVYLAILRRAIDEHAQADTHELVVAFPEADQLEIVRLAQRKA